MISKQVQMVHNNDDHLRYSRYEKVCNIVHRSAPSIKKSMPGAHRFTIFITFYSRSLRRDFVNKCTYVHQTVLRTINGSYSEALTPCHMLLLMAFMVGIFLYALMVTMRYAA